MTSNLQIPILLNVLNVLYFVSFHFSIVLYPICGHGEGAISVKWEFWVGRNTQYPV